jgi:hypothetical protein
VRKELIDFSAVAMVELCKGAVDAEPAMCYGDMAKLDKTLAKEVVLYILPLVYPDPTPLVYTAVRTHAIY